jgi:hypothetical protein
MPISSEPVPMNVVVEFILANHEALPLRYESGRDAGFDGSEFIKQMTKNSQFIENVGLRMADYMNKYGVEDILHTSNKKVINDLVGMIKCEMVDFGYREMPKQPPREVSLQYIQSLGYDDAAMAEKKEILSRWLQDKVMSYDERLVARAIIDDKVLHTLTDIDMSSLRRRKEIPIFTIYEKTDSIGDVMIWGGKLSCTHKNLASGEIENGTIVVPECKNINDRHWHSWLQESEHMFGHVGDAMYLNWDISEAYHKLGGFDYGRAMEQAHGRDHEQEQQDLGDPRIR